MTSKMRHVRAHAVQRETAELWWQNMDSRSGGIMTPLSDTKKENVSMDGSALDKVTYTCVYTTFAAQAWAAARKRGYHFSKCTRHFALLIQQRKVCVEWGWVLAAGKEKEPGAKGEKNRLSFRWENETRQPHSSSPSHVGRISEMAFACLYRVALFCSKFGIFLIKNKRV